jgi:hypothetical protein
VGICSRTARAHLSVVSAASQPAVCKERKGGAPIVRVVSTRIKDQGSKIKGKGSATHPEGPLCRDEMGGRAVQRREERPFSVGCVESIVCWPPSLTQAKRGLAWAIRPEGLSVSIMELLIDGPRAPICPEWDRVTPPAQTLLAARMRLPNASGSDHSLPALLHPLFPGCRAALRSSSGRNTGSTPSPARGACPA